MGRDSEKMEKEGREPVIISFTTLFCRVCLNVAGRDSRVEVAGAVKINHQI